MIRVDEYSSIAEDLKESPQTQIKKRKFAEVSAIIAIEVCDIICFQAKERFKFLGHLSAAKLLACEKFSYFCKDFPSKYLDETVEGYPMLKKEKLRTELSVLYERAEFSNFSGAFNLHKFIVDHGLQNSLGEVNCLLKIILTTLMSTSEPERCFSTLKRIKTFLRSTMLEDRLSALTMLSEGEDLIRKIKNFNEKVIEEFSSRKERRMCFVFK